MSKIEKKDEIKAQKVGKNLVLVIDGKKLVKKDITPKDLLSISNKIKLYNKKPTESVKKTIISLIDTKAVEKDKKEAVKKGVKKQIKKETKSTKKTIKKKIETKRALDTLCEEIKTKQIKNEDLTPDEISTLEALLSKAKEVKKEEPKAQEAPFRRSGEH